jgi:hypothetical protein
MRQSEIRRAFVTLRLRPDEKARLERYAEEQEIGLSDVLREALTPILTDPAPAGARAGQTMQAR